MPNNSGEMTRLRKHGDQQDLIGEGGKSRPGRPNQEASGLSVHAGQGTGPFQGLNEDKSIMCVHGKRSGRALTDLPAGIIG